MADKATLDNAFDDSDELDLPLDPEVARELGIEQPDEPAGSPAPTASATPAAAPSAPAPASPATPAGMDFGPFNELLRSMGYKQSVSSFEEAAHIIRSARGAMYDAQERAARAERGQQQPQTQRFTPPGAGAYPNPVPFSPNPGGYAQPDGYDPDNPLAAHVIGLGREVATMRAEQEARMREEAASRFDQEMAGLSQRYPWITEEQRRQVSLEVAETGAKVSTVFRDLFGDEIEQRAQETGARNLAARLKQNATAARAIPASMPAGGAAVSDPKTMSAEDQAKWLDAEIDRCLTDREYARQRAEEAADTAGMW